MTRRIVAAAVAVVAVAASGLTGAPGAQAVGVGVRQTRVVSEVPSTSTPNVTDGTVYAIAKVGGNTILGGNFTKVTNRGSSDSLPRAGLLAFNANTGTVSTTFVPTLDGTVQSLAPGPLANTVYVGGYFNNVDGVHSKGITLLNTVTGRIVAGFSPPALNGPVFSIGTSGRHVFITGGFTLVGSLSRLGFASLASRSGADDGFVSIPLEGHHNYNGSGAQGAVGGRALAVNPAGTRLMVIGNFTSAGRLPRDQIAMIDIDGSVASVDRQWATQKFTAACARNSFDTYMTDVQYAPDGSYFAITTTGGASTANSDGSNSLCDTVSRWNSADTGAAVAPAWVDETGKDTLWSVAISGTAVYVGGHQRWLNNSNGADKAGPGAVPRPGVAALDPANGIPLSWDPGRNPRGAGAYALLVTSNGLYVGSDTDYFGNFTYNRQKIGYFPMAGGKAAARTTVATLPGRLYLGGPRDGQDGLAAGDLAYRTVNGTRIGASVKVANERNWDAVRGAFVVGPTLYYGSTNGSLYKARFTPAGLNQPTLVDPYNDPKWATVTTGSGQTYRGLQPSYFDELDSVTGAFYSAGRMFYTVQGRSALYWRWFSPDSGVIGADEYTITGADFSAVSGITVSGDTLYYAKADGTLHTMSFTDLTPKPATDTVISGPNVDGRDWAARNLLIYG